MNTTTYLTEVTIQKTNWTRIGVKSPRTGNILWVNQGWIDNTLFSVIDKWNKAEAAHLAAGGGILQSTFSIEITLEEFAAFYARNQAEVATKKSWRK